MCEISPALGNSSRYAGVGLQTQILRHSLFLFIFLLRSMSKFWDLKFGQHLSGLFLLFCCVLGTIVTLTKPHRRTWFLAEHTIYFSGPFLAVFHTNTILWKKMTLIKKCMTLYQTQNDQHFSSYGTNQWWTVQTNSKLSYCVFILKPDTLLKIKQYHSFLKFH